MTRLPSSDPLDAVDFGDGGELEAGGGAGEDAEEDGDEGAGGAEEGVMTSVCR